MTTNLFDALEICLQALNKGADLESCLALFPDYLDDLRPILTAAVQTKSIAVSDVPADVMSRGKERVLQAAAEMRERLAPAVASASRDSRRKNIFGARFLRLAITTASMFAFLLTGGTGLVNASSSALPGDKLYPVKRSWEGVQLFFVIDDNSKTVLRDEFEHKRVQEIEELYSEKRVAEVDFNGVVNSVASDIWVVGGLNIAIDQNTRFSAEILTGSTVHVIGETDDGVIKAGQIVLIAVPGTTPTVEPSIAPSPTLRIESSRTPEPTENVDGGNGDDNIQNTPEASEPTKKPDDHSEGDPTKTPSHSENKPHDGGGSKNDNGGSNHNGNDHGGGGNDNNDNHNGGGNENHNGDD